MKKAIVLSAEPTKLTAEQKEQWLRVVFLDPSTGKDASRLFDMNRKVAYIPGEAIEGIQVKTVECKPYTIKTDAGEKILTKKSCVIMEGESDLQGLANTHSKYDIVDAPAKVEEKEPVIK